jgi:hypothetical protein
MTDTVTFKITDVYLESPCKHIPVCRPQLLGLFRRNSSKSDTDNAMDVEKYITH